MADESPIQVLKEEGREATAKSYMWLFRSGEDDTPPIVLYNMHQRYQRRCCKRISERF